MMDVLIKKNKIFFKNLSFVLFCVTFLFHESFVLLLNSGVLKVPFNIGDHINYHIYALKISELIGLGTYVPGAIYGSHWYPLFVGFLYFIFGNSIIFSASINAVLIALSSFFIFKIILMFDEKINEKVVFWVVFFVMNFFASLMLYTSLLLKESLIIFFIIIILYFSLKIFFGGKIKFYYLIFILVSFILLRNLRFFIGIASILGFFIGWFFTDFIKIKKRIIYGLLMVFFVTIITFGISKIEFINMLSAPSVVDIVKLKFINETRNAYFLNGSTTTNIDVVEKDAVSGEYDFLPSGILKSFLNIMFGPFPWQLGIRNYLLVLPELILWYVVFFTAILGFLKTNIKKSSFFLVTVFVILSGLVFGVDNLGALIRYRIPLVVFLSIFSAIGVDFLIKNIKYKIYENSLYNN